MQISPVLAVLVKGLFPPGPAASGRSGAAAGGTRPLPHLENRISTAQPPLAVNYVGFTMMCDK